MKSSVKGNQTVLHFTADEKVNDFVERVYLKFMTLQMSNEWLAKYERTGEQQVISCK